MAGKPLRPTTPSKETEGVEPLNPRYPFRMRPFPYALAGARTKPLTKQEAGIPLPVDSSNAGN